MKPENIATYIAEALANEIGFPIELDDEQIHNMVKKLYDEPPPRSKLSFLKRSHKNKKLRDLTKRKIAPTLATTEELDKIEVLLCVGCIGFQNASTISIEHANAFEAILNKQKKLITFLNDASNQAITDELLKKEGMNNFFRWDNKGEKILTYLLNNREKYNAYQHSSDQTIRGNLRVLFRKLESYTDIFHIKKYNESRFNAEEEKLMIDFLKNEIISSFINEPKSQEEHILTIIERAGVNKYFRKTVKGTQYFYRMCYDNFHNLWLLCQGCNASKGAEGALDGFGCIKSSLGKDLLQHYIKKENY